MKTGRYIILFAAIIITISACQAKQSVPSPIPPTKAEILASEQNNNTGALPSGSIAAEESSAVAQENPMLSPSPTPSTQATSISPQPVITESPPPTEAPSQLSTPSVDNPQPVDQSEPTATCIDQAAFYDDITVPDGTVFRQGDKFTKTWRVRNTGSCPWGADYKLVFSGGEPMSAPLINAIPEAQPGDILDLSLDLTAPTGGGEYVSSWEFENSQGNRFGVGITGKGPVWAKIVVGWIPPNSEATPGDGASSEGSPPVSDTSNSNSGIRTTCGATRQPSVEAQIVTFINQARSENGLNTLSVQDQVAAAAVKHSTDMACNDFTSHVGSDGSNWGSRIAAQGYQPLTSYENIYYGSPTFGGNAQGAFNWWMNSQVHRDNILNPEISSIGVGYVFNPATGFGYYTVNFTNP